MKKIAALVLVLAAVGLAAYGGPASATIVPDSNTVAFWCGSEDLGVKFDPVGTPFTVPDPPAGSTWTLLVLKAGAQESADPVNELFPNPVPGNAYPRTDNKTISHAILCFGPTQQTVPTTQPTSTTATTNPTTTMSTTTSTSTSSSSTSSSTSTSCPDCTINTVVITSPPTTPPGGGGGGGGGGTTAPTTVAITTATTTATTSPSRAGLPAEATDQFVVTTTAPTTTASSKTTLPVTGINDALWWVALVAVIVTAFGLAIVAGERKRVRR